ncbi:hypothetical protein IFM89_003482 [Coptis chinensis]|uniref:Uncharacterized protein n=1 Tax=Coptis chinensis TaxID=261450 RepID=A0A835HB35_9MAGN|nr:hypothetical protein IFM89_003482 [Coptis chinensis]
MGNLVDVAYGIHERLAGDLNGGDESEGGDLEPPYVLEPDLGKRKQCDRALVHVKKMVAGRKHVAFKVSCNEGNVKRFGNESQVYRCMRKQLTLAEKLNMTYDEAERWIVNLVRNSKLDERLIPSRNCCHGTQSCECIIENTKALSLCTYKYANLVLESAQVQTAI